MEHQGLIGRAEVRHASVVVEQRSAEKEEADQIVLVVFTQTHKLCNPLSTVKHLESLHVQF